MPSSRIALALALALLAAAPRARTQLPEPAAAWAPDPRLALVLPVTLQPSAAASVLVGASTSAPVERRRGTRHAITSILAGAMAGTMLGMVESAGPRLHCESVTEAPVVITCPPPESAGRPIVIGAVLGAATGLLFHLLRPAPSAESERPAPAW
jgi:hypothetical protein